MSTTSTATREEILAANRRFTSAVASRDTQTIAQFYADDGMVLPNGGEPVSGRAAIERFWRQAIDSFGLKSLQLETLKVEPHGDVVVEIGRCSVTMEPGGETDRGSYMVIWRKEHGNLKVVADIWNSSSPQKP